MIDWNRIHELCSEVGEEDFRVVVGLFLEEADEAVERLRSAPDLGRLAADLHFLKGSSMNLGFARFATLCAEGEQAAGALELAPLLAAYDDSRQMLLEGLEAGLQSTNSATV